MIKTKFDLRFREIPLDIDSLKNARQGVQSDLAVAMIALENDPNELDQIDYYRLLSRASDLDRFELNYSDARVGFKRTSLFWKSIDWGKAAFLCDLKAALCRGYLDESFSVEDFDSLFEQLKSDDSLQIYYVFVHQYRGQLFAFHKQNRLAEVDFRLGLKISTDSKKKKQIQRFTDLMKMLNSDW